jgi:hypothetical protein
MTLSFDQIIKSIKQLPAAEQERIRRWLNDKEATSGERHGSQARAKQFDKVAPNGCTKTEKSTRGNGSH